jgi:alkylation response protein AidB-like acyl-CoA dehydrogenase
MDYGFTEYQSAIRDLAREIAEKEIRPVAAEYDREGKFPWPVVKVLAETDLFRVFVDEKYGGMTEGSPIMNMCIVTEELSKACGGIALSFAGTALGAIPIILSGSEEQKQRWLPDVAAGKRLAAFALTEPQAGSDAAAVRTTALRDGGHYVLNGTKQWITNGGEAELYSVIALTNPAKGPRGASCIVVEKGTPGFTFGKKEDKLGIRASATRELIFQAARARASSPPCARSTSRVPAWARRRWGSRRARSISRLSTPARAGSSTRRLAPSRACVSCSPTWR